MNQYCVKAVVSGRVQGVGFRYDVKKRAEELSLTGHASNLTNGDVEVTVCGEKEKVDQLIEWLWQGPPAAQVTQVQIESSDWHDYSGFKTD
ncbi:acylphosphatase [Halomonas sp. PR-M31]|uniref:acylphosphatase n=1 Tax=Halomonas sp. PR-M31 TaxID=1471202 RepID=UPI00065189B6|nr:acylphosphatase [Halomonas sp. PR-M31]